MVSGLRAGLGLTDEFFTGTVYFVYALVLPGYSL